MHAYERRVERCGKKGIEREQERHLLASMRKLPYTKNVAKLNKARVKMQV